MQSDMSLMKHKNNRGPSTVPCGTPDATLMDLEDCPSQTTYDYVIDYTVT